ncbi:MAG: PadR family transcriptional regulator [Faecousia sp.]
MGADELRKQPPSALEDNLKKALTELMILFLLSQKDCYIGELTAMINRRSGGALTIVFPYGAIYRLQQSGYILELEKRTAPDGRRCQYYRITKPGRQYLEQLLDTYSRLSKGISDVLTKEEGAE